MWIFLNNSFFSVVDHSAVTSRRTNKKPLPTDKMVVRARIKGDLARAFGKGFKEIETPDADYRYRIFVSRQKVAAVVMKAASLIGYANFKDSIPPKDTKRHDAYLQVWAAMERVQPRKRSLYQMPEDWFLPRDTP